MRTILLLLILCTLPLGLGYAADTPDQAGVAQSDIQNKEQNQKDQRIAELSLQMFVVQGPEKIPIVRELLLLGDQSLIPSFVLAMRLTGSNIYVANALSTLTGEPIKTWHDAYEWQERHPHIIPHKSFRELKLRFLGARDERFLSFFAPPHGSTEKMRIRLEEIVWGGVPFDGIRALERPTMIGAVDADYLLDTDLVFGVEINGDARAYPLRIMGWHEMANDVIGGIPVALAYCTLCGSGILYDTQLTRDNAPLTFGSSGLLYRSNKLMFDRNTNTLWNQFTGEPVVGALADSGIKLRVRPITIATWASWRQLHPNTRVLSLNTGYSHNYDSGVTYKDYFASPDLMFPAYVNDEQASLARKDFIFGVRSVAASKAWPMHVFSETPVINDQVGLQSLVLFGDANSRTVRAYERYGDEKFTQSADGSISTDDHNWVLTENFLITPDNKQRRARLPGRISYWFAWENFLGLKSELYQP